MLPFPAGPAQIAAACLCGLEFTQRAGIEAILKCSFNKISQPRAKYVSVLQSWGGLPTFLGKSPLAFIHTHLKHIYLAFQVLPSTLIKQSKPQCFAATFSSSCVWVSCGKAHMLAAPRKIQDSPAAGTPALGWSHRQLCAWLVSSLSKVAGLFSGKSFPLDPFLILGNWHTSPLFKS